MRSPLSLLAATQVAFKSNVVQPPRMRNQNTNFALREADNIFSPKNLVELGRPGAGVANELGDLVLVPFAKYSLKDKKCVPAVSRS